MKPLVVLRKSSSARNEAIVVLFSWIEHLHPNIFCDYLKSSERLGEDDGDERRHPISPTPSDQR